MHILSKKSVFTWEFLGIGEQGGMGLPSLPSTLPVSEAHRANRRWSRMWTGVTNILITGLFGHKTLFEMIRLVSPFAFLDLKSSTSFLRFFFEIWSCRVQYKYSYTAEGRELLIKYLLYVLRLPHLQVVAYSYYPLLTQPYNFGYTNNDIKSWFTELYKLSLVIRQVIWFWQIINDNITFSTFSISKFICDAEGGCRQRLGQNWLVQMYH